MIRHCRCRLTASRVLALRTRSFPISFSFGKQLGTVNMFGRPATRTALTFLMLLGITALPCNGDSPLLEEEYDFHILRLESRAPVKTWEKDGVRVFLAEEGALIRQGPVQVTAPRMVVWFDKGLSSSPDVRAAVVKVYAEGAASEEGTEPTPVRLIEGSNVRECGALLMRFKSTVSFTWDCPLVKSEDPALSVLLARAEMLTKGVEEDTSWDEMPAPGPLAVIRALMPGIKADQFQSWWLEDPICMVWMGDVHATLGNLEIRADAAVAWLDVERARYELYARGNVRIGRKAGAVVQPEGQTEEEAGIADTLQSLRADEIYINPGLSRGLATNLELRVRDPRAPAETVYVFRGEEAYLINSKSLTITEVSAASCQFARPHYQFKSEKVQLVRAGPSLLMSAWDTQIQVGESQRTLLWVPFVGMDLSRRAYLLNEYAVGRSSKFGTFVQTTWTPLDLTTSPSWVDEWTVNLDYYSARGPAIGTELLYEFGREPYPRHEGRVRGYYVSDSGRTDETGDPVPQQGRTRLHVEHRTQLNRDWRVDAEYYRLSDYGFLNEYFEADFEEEKTPESYLLARYLRNSTYLALLYGWRTNDFLTQVEEGPSVDLQMVGVPVGPFVYKGSAEAGHYDLELSDILRPEPLDPPGLWRFHTEHELSLPFSWGIFRFDPSVRALATGVTESAMDGGDFQDAESRTGTGFGLTASTTFSRAFGLTSELLDLNRLRHILTPYVGIDSLSVSGAESAQFIQMDRVDAIDTGTEVTLGLRQQLQTKRRREGKWRSVDWAKVDVAYVSRSSDSVMTALDEDYLRGDFELQLTDNLSLHSRDDWLGGGDQPDVWNLGAALDYLPKWALEVDYDRISDLTSTLTMDLSYQLSDRYRLLVVEQYEFDSRGEGEEKNMVTRLIVRRLLHEWILDVGLHIEEANEEFALVLGFGPKGWGAHKDFRRTAQ